MSANLAGLLDGPARWAASRPAVSVGEEVVHTWSSFASAVAARAGALRATFGVAPGDAVALYAANHPAYLEILFSVWWAGGVAVPISSRLHPREVADLLASSHARVCFADEPGAAGLDGLAPEGVRVLGLDDPSARAGDPIAPSPRGPGDDAWIFFTSGTTGRAKGARLSHSALLAMTAAFHADVDFLDASDSMIHIAALSHASGLMALPFVARGAEHVLPPSMGYDLDELIALVAARRRSTFFVPPALLRRLGSAPEAAALDGSRIGTIMVGAAPVGVEDIKACVERFGPVVWNGYGQGETPCTATALSKAEIGAAVAAGDDARLATVGVARFCTRVRVDAQVGEVGEVLVDGPTVMSGYLDLPDATAEALRDGWLHTGDLGRFSDDGYLTLVDRAKDVVITGGYNVYPREVEDVLITHASVGEVAVVGLPDPEWGERIAAFVVPAAGASVDEAALDALCLSSIARHKRPTVYRVVDELPRNAAGKVLKKSLREGAMDAAR